MENLGPNLIAHNGKVITVDESFSVADAVAVKAGRIIGVGGGAAMLEKADGHTRIIDLAGRVMMPGLIDGHAHMDREGLKYLLPSLEGARSIEDILGRIEALVAQAEPGAWVFTMPIGDPPSYFDLPEMLAEKRFPTRHDLDRVSPHNPVYIRSIWGFWRHTLPLVSIANSRALDVAGITRATSNPSPTVKIERDEAGEPTGIFVENTYIPIVELTLMRASGGFVHEDRVRGLKASMRAYHAAGTTSIYEEHGIAAEVLAAYKTLWEQGELSMRCNLVFSPAWDAVDGVPFATLIPKWAAWLAGRGLGDDHLRIGGIYTEISTNIDNALRAQASPYTGWGGFNYDSSLGRQQVKELLIEAARNDIRVNAIWPDVLELYKEVNAEIPLAGRGWVFGHIAVLRPADIEAIKEMGLVLTTHTNRHIFKEGHLRRDEAGEGAENDVVPLRSLIDAGVPFGLATDNVPVSMFHPIWHCVSRYNKRTDGAIAPAQAITRAEALRAATMGGAALTSEENEKGSLEPGKLADLAVLSDDPLTCAEGALKDITAELTMVGGRIVHQREGGG
ncbi:MAG: amidohydrolase [Rhodospirillales bacterium]|nr:amidohydrolase [Rhodospirillales bacterium]